MSLAGEKNKANATSLRLSASDLDVNVRVFTGKDAVENVDDTGREAL